MLFTCFCWDLLAAAVGTGLALVRGLFTKIAEDFGNLAGGGVFFVVDASVEDELSETGGMGGVGGLL